MGNTVITREGEAVPVRLLPIASKSTVTAERWARILAQTDPDMSLAAYHFVDGLMMELPPKYWRDRSSEDHLPPGAFVWREELEAAYSRVFYTDALSENAPDGPEYIEIIEDGEDAQGEPRYILELNNDLLLDAPLDSEEQRQWVFEGFGPLQAYAAAPTGHSSMLTERGIWEIHFNDSHPVPWDAIAQLHFIARTRAIFWMHGLSPARHQILTDLVDDEHIQKAVPARVRGVMGVEEFFESVRRAHARAASEKMEEATASGWVAWADERGIAVHSKFRTIAEHELFIKSEMPASLNAGEDQTRSDKAESTMWWQIDYGDLLDAANVIAARMRKDQNFIKRGKGHEGVSANKVCEEIAADIAAAEKRRTIHTKNRPRSIGMDAIKKYLKKRGFNPNPTGDAG